MIYLSMTSFHNTRQQCGRNVRDVIVDCDCRRKYESFIMYKINLLLQRIYMYKASAGSQLLVPDLYLTDVCAF